MPKIVFFCENFRPCGATEKKENRKIYFFFPEKNEANPVSASKNAIGVAIFDEKNTVTLVSLLIV